MAQTNLAEPNQALLDLLARGALLAVIVDALAETVAKYTQRPTVAGKPQLIQDSTSRDVSVAGMVRFEGADFSIELFLGLSKELFESLYESLFQHRPTEITAENHDLAGEILNVSFGLMDPKLRSQNLKLRASLPVIYSKERLTLALGRITQPAIEIPFQNGTNEFVIKLYSANGLNEKWTFDPH